MGNVSMVEMAGYLVLWSVVTCMVSLAVLVAYLVIRFVRGER